MAFTSAPGVAVYTRLQENLRAGLSSFSYLWQYTTKDWVTGVHAADINQDGDIEALAGSRDGRVCALSREGTVGWEIVVPEKSWVTAVVACPPSLDQQATSVVSTRDGKIYVLNQQGEVLPPPGTEPGGPEHWCDMGLPINHLGLDTSRPLTIVFSVEDHCIYSFDLVTNQMRWSFKTNDEIRAIFLCDIDHDGSMEVLFGSDNQSLYVLSNAGVPLSSVHLDQAIYALSAEDIDKDGMIEILVGTRTRNLFALTADLKPKWSYTLSSRPLAITVADVNNDRQPEILVSCDDQSLSILDNLGRLVWRQLLGRRYQNLNAFDLDRDGYVEILAGADDSRIYAFRIQLSKDLDKRIRRDYVALGKPDITTLVDLTNDQLNLLQALLGTSYGAIDKKLNLALAKALMDAGNFTAALLTLAKLDQQRFQMVWEKERMGYRRSLCLVNLGSEQSRKVVMSSLNGGIAVFNAKGRLLWTAKSADSGEIFDAQSGYLSTDQSEDLAFISATGKVSILDSDGSVADVALNFSGFATCFYVYAPGSPIASEILIGTNEKQAYLYTTDFGKPAQTFNLPAPVQRVYISEPDASRKYRKPEILISTSENQLFAYSRGGNCLWTYRALSQIKALYVKDLYGDGRLEVLIGVNDRNVYVLDDAGNLLWRYVLYHSVLALETADLDGDGQQEILAGCADGILYVFTSQGDLIWRYSSKDRIQALRVADIDLDGNFEILMIEEGHVEVLRVVEQRELDILITKCWENLFATHDPLEVLLPLIKGSDPHLRAAGLLKLSQLDPLPPETLKLLEEAKNDPFTDVRKAVLEALMYVYSENPAQVLLSLNTLFTDRQREVRIEVVEHLEVLARYDWAAVFSYLERALRWDDRNTRRAALRRISHLLREYKDEIKSSQKVLGEELFRLLLIGAQDKMFKTSLWVKQEAGRVLADFLNLFEEDFLSYLYRMFATRLGYTTLNYTAYNLASPLVRDAVVQLIEISYNFQPQQASAMITRTTGALEAVKTYTDATDLWLIFREFQKLFAYTTLEEFAAYDFHVNREAFQETYRQTPAFFHIGEQLDMVTRPLKAYLHRNDPNDRLSSLLDSMSALDALLRLVNREYSVSPLPDALLPLVPDFIILRAFIEHWQALFNVQRSELRGYAEVVCDLQSRTAHLEEIVGIWLQVSNSGRAPARKVKITLLSDESFAFPRQTPMVFETDLLLAGQETMAEFLIKPLGAAATLTFEVLYNNSEADINEAYQERVTFIERSQPFTQLTNPYITGSPIHDRRMFYGREADIAYLLDNLTRKEGQSVLVLYGQRRSGKTTLLNQLANSDLLSEHIAVKIDLQKMALELNLNKFFFKIAYEIARRMLKRGLCIAVPQQADFFGEQVDPQFSFELFLDEARAVLGGYRLILLFDEFEELEKQVEEGCLTPKIFTYLRSLVQERHDFHFLLSGIHTIQELTHSYWSVFFNTALHYRLPSKISPRGAEELITKPVSNLEYEPLAVRKIRLLTADQPYLINLVCHELVSHCNFREKNYVTINDVNLVLRNVLETGQVHFNWLWIGKLTTKVLQILLLIVAEGCKDEGRELDLEDIRAICEKHGLRYSQEVILHALRALVAEDVIETGAERHEVITNNTRYSFPNGLLRQWLRRTQSLHELIQQSGDSSLFMVSAKEPVESLSQDSYELSRQERFADFSENLVNGYYDSDQLPARLRSPEL